MDVGSLELVEEMGMYFKGLGLPRAAGRMFGFLMVCSPSEQTAGAIGDATGLSLASISSNVRLLQRLGAVEQRGRAGDRKAHYRLGDDVWMDLARQNLRSFEDLAQVARRIELAGGVPHSDALDEMEAFAEFWEDELPGISARWDARRKSRRTHR